MKNKMLILGIVLAVSMLSAVGFASTQLKSNNDRNTQATNGAQMHGKGMPCAGLDSKEMDKNNDGNCDYCGMKVENCKQMQQEMHGNNNVRAMHEQMHSQDSKRNSASCRMNNNNGMHSNGGMTGNSGMHSIMN